MHPYSVHCTQQMRQWQNFDIQILINYRSQIKTSNIPELSMSMTCLKPKKGHNFKFILIC